MLELMLHLKPQFTDEDKERCIPLILQMLDIAEDTRREGILTLGLKIESEDSLFMKSCLEIITEVCDKEPVGRAMRHLIMAENHTGFELLSRFIIAEGFLLINDLESPRSMALQLGAMLGEKYCSRAKDALESANSEAALKVNRMAIERLLKNADIKKTLPQRRELELIVCNMSDEAIQRVLREVSGRELVTMLSGSSRKMIGTVFMNISWKSSMISAEDIEVMDNHRDEDVENAAGKILNIIKRLEDAGEIVPSHKADKAEV